ncbi:MAG TPA: L,D-transpeptidase [Longimicrobiaceae bacterium]|nr:L,D-transpeptidase [Longimicrobiaceae bacterium]
MKLRLALALIPTLAAASPAHAQTRTEAPVRIVLNLPAGRLDLYRGEEPLKSYPVSVGTAAYRTPGGSFRIRHAIWNPDWTPPRSDWARNRRYTPPGPGNPMGRVKLHLAGDVYIHGTPGGNERLLGSPASHGCVRMSNRDVMELARTLHLHASPGVSEQRLDAIAAEPRRTAWVALARPVPVEVVYRVVEVREGRVTVHPDVYGRVHRLEPALRAALLGAGYHPFALDGERLARAEANFRSGGRTVFAIAELRPRPEPVMKLAATLP